MKRILWVLLLLPLLVSARFERNVSLQAGDTVHCAADALVLTSNVDARCAVYTATPTPTRTPTVVFLPTVTSTPQPSATSTPSATAIGTPLSLAQYPLCPSHDDTLWHALIDATRQCRYDHEHGDNPALGDAVFGAVIGQTISYAWATSAMENTHKHGGYKYAVYLDAVRAKCNPFGDHAEYGLSAPPNCIVAARIEYHFVSSSLDGLARYHSYTAEYQICQYPAYTACGIFRTGGWADLGVLNVPYAGARVFRPGGTIDFGLGSTYGGANSDILMAFSADTPDLDQIASTGAFPCCDEPYASMPVLGELPAQIVWSLNNLGQFNHFGSNPYLRFSVRTLDAWDTTDPNNPNALHFICRDGSCASNGSKRELAEMTALIPSAWDADADGFADASGYTNRLGQVVSGCTAIALDCVPYSAVHVPIGVADTRDTGCECNWMVEYDTAPIGAHWIAYPN